MYIKISDKYEDKTKIVETREVEHRGVLVSHGEMEIAHYPELNSAKEIEFFGCVYYSAPEEGADDKASAVILTIPTKEGHRAIVAVACSIYVMGDDGKTIDVIRY